LHDPVQLGAGILYSVQFEQQFSEFIGVNSARSVKIYVLEDLAKVVDLVLGEIFY